MTDAAESSKKPGDATPGDEGLTGEERRMLDTLASGGAARPAAAPVAPAGDARSSVPARPGAATGAAADLSLEEEQVLREAREESERLAQTTLQQMFETDHDATGPTAGFEALLAVPPEPEEAAPEPSAFDRSRTGRALAAVLDFINAPFRWLPRAYRLGLGLCGVLLLVTLLVVILVRALRP